MILMLISCHHTKAGDEDEEHDEQRVEFANYPTTIITFLPLSTSPPFQSWMAFIRTPGE